MRTHSAPVLQQSDPKELLVRPSTLSPFRYPGGKSWLRKRVLSWIKKLESSPSILVEPFAGGASIALAAVEMNIVQRAILIERDPDVAAVWRVILGNGWKKLNNKILSFNVSRGRVLRVLGSSERDSVSIAFRCLLRNRVQRGGILAPSAGLLRRGEDGQGLKSRWYPKTLIARINKIHGLRNRIQIIQGDALLELRKYQRRTNCVFFIDPPYTANGKGPGIRLYRFAEIDHENLLELIASIRGPCFVTYHPNANVRRLAQKLGFKFSTTRMRNAHHRYRREMVLSKTLSKRKR